MPYDDLIEKHANRVGVDPAWMKRIMRIESGGNPSNTTGSYKGLFQLSNQEFRRHGGSGSIYDPEQNTAAAANKLAQESRDFKTRYGRDPKLTDLYMIHQQGEAGYAAHMSNPDAPAWQNMASTGEGKQRGAAWAKAAIWGNLSPSAKARFGSVENVSSRDFVDTWDDSIKGGGTDYRAPKDGTVAKDGDSSPAKVASGEKKPTLLGVLSEPMIKAPNVDLQFPSFTPRINI